MSLETKIPPHSFLVNHALGVACPNLGLLKQTSFIIHNPDEEATPGITVADG
jgi:hypothetical protein